MSLLVFKGIIMKYQNVGGYIIGHLQYAVPEDAVSNVRDTDAFMDKLGEILSGHLPAGDDWINAIDKAVEFSLPKEFTPQQLAEHDSLATYLADWDNPFDDTVSSLLSGSDVGVEPHKAYQTVDPVTLGKLIASMYELLQSRYTQLSDAWVDGCMPEVKKTRQRRRKPSLRVIPNETEAEFSVSLPFEGQNSDAKGS